jgi:hypothetical protein
VQEIWQQAANLATLISGRAIGRTLTPDDNRRLVDEALAEIQDISEKKATTAAALADEWARQGGGKA